MAVDLFTPPPKKILAAGSGSTGEGVNLISAKKPSIFTPPVKSATPLFTDNDRKKLLNALPDEVLANGDLNDIIEALKADYRRQGEKVKTLQGPVGDTNLGESILSAGRIAKTAGKELLKYLPITSPVGVALDPYGKNNEELAAEGKNFLESVSKVDKKNLLKNTKGFVGQATASAIDQSVQMVEGILKVPSLFGGDSRESATNLLDLPQTKMRKYRDFLQKVDPESLRELDQEDKIDGISPAARITGELAGSIPATFVGAGQASGFVRALPVVQKLAKAGKMGYVGASILENAAANIGAALALGAEKQQDTDEIARNIALSPSVLLPFSLYGGGAIGRTGKGVTGALADYMIARYGFGMSEEESLLNSLGGAAEGLTSRPGYTDFLRSAQSHAETITQLARTSQDNPLLVKKLMDDLGASMVKERRLIESGDGFTKEKGRLGIERPSTKVDLFGQTKAQETLDTVGKNVDISSETLPDADQVLKERTTELRGHLQSLQKSKFTSPEFKEKIKSIDPQTYVVHHDQEVFDLADEFINDNIVKARDFALSDAPADDLKGAVTVKLQKHYENLALSSKDPLVKEEYFAKATELSKKFDTQARAGGRYNRMGYAYDYLNGETVHYTIMKDLKKLGVELSPEETLNLKDMTKRLQGTSDLAQKAEINDQIIDLLSGKVKPTNGDYWKAYTYQNMLFGRAMYRNFISNAFNTFVTRPLDMIGEASTDAISTMFTGKERLTLFRDVPKYYVDTIANMRQAFQAYGDVIKGKTPISNADFALDPSAAVNAAKQKNLPKGLTMATRHMEAGDRLYSVLIGNAEKGRLIRNGIPEKEAAEQAKEIAKEYLYRQALNSRDTTKPFLSRGVDFFGELAIGARSHAPGPLQPVLQAAVPFVTTPTAVARMSIEHSPLGFIGGSYSAKQLTRATMGSVLMGMAGMAMLEGRVTGPAPEDAEEKKKFYDSGMKPWSVMVGGKSIPFNYFGPFGLALTMGASLAYRFEKGESSLTDSGLEKFGSFLADLAKSISQQTSMQGMTNIFNALSGEPDYSFPGSVGFMGSQIIPFSALQREANKIIDGVYRKGNTLEAMPMQSIVGLSSKVEPVLDSEGNPAKRDPMNFLLPWDVGRVDQQKTQDFNAMMETKKDVAPYREGATEEKKKVKAEAQSIFTNFKALSAQEKDNEMLKLYNKDPKMFVKVRDLFRADKKDVTPEQKVILSLGVEDGSRAEYIGDRVRELGTAKEKREYIKELIKKKVITKGVIKTMDQETKKYLY